MNMNGPNAAESYGPGGCRIDSSYSAIVPGLFVGGLSALAYCPQDQGCLDLLVCCAREACGEDSGLSGPEPGAWAEVLLCPLDDEEGLPVPAGMVEPMAEEVAKRVGGGQKVLVFCAEGRNRSGLIAALALLRLGHADPVALLRERRHRSVLTNKTFAAYVERVRKQEA